MSEPTVNRHGRAKVLTQSEIQEILNHGLQNDRDRTLFGVCLFTACRIREACTLLTEDIYTPSGLVRPKLILRKANTKGKLATRSIPVIQDLRQLLTSYRSLAGEIYLFPGRSDVRRIVIWYKLGLTPEEILNRIGHPTLTLAQVYAALTYYHANQKEIETDIAAEEATSKIV